MRLYRMKVRVILVLVACVVVLSWACEMGQRSAYYFEGSQNYERRGVRRQIELDMIEHQKPDPQGYVACYYEPLEVAIAGARHRLEVERALAARFRRAAWHPWLPAPTRGGL